MKKEDALKLWGHPETPADIAQLFSKFCKNELSALPWSDQGLLTETSAIAGQLAKMNELGFLTINSQPAVNGASSDDKVFGWGPRNGYVYQKVCTLLFLIETAVLIEELVSGIPRVLCVSRTPRRSCASSREGLQHHLSCH